MRKREIPDREILGSNKETPQRDHPRCLAAVIRTNKDSGLISQINPNGFQLPEILDFNQFDLHAPHHASTTGNQPYLSLS